tara:strand:- start:22916 stop:23293 length:378 start_codon:yes stop_codon:yes gene_type:complete
MVTAKFETPEQNERFLTGVQDQWTFAVCTQMMAQGVGPTLNEKSLSTLIGRMKIYFALNEDDGEGESYIQHAIDRLGMHTNIFPEMTDLQWERKQLRRWMKEYTDRRDHKEPTSAYTDFDGITNE